mgnify:FL=1
MNIPALERYLKSFGSQIVKEAKGNLVAAGKGGALASSIDFFIIKRGGSVTLRFKMSAYGKYVDKGVSGNKVTRTFTDRKGKTQTSPFRYTTKQPPSGIIEKWIKRKGLKGRDKKGRFITHKSLSFLIARSIKSKGIQGISFFQKPLMIGMKQFEFKFGAAIKADILLSLK